MAPFSCSQYIQCAFCSLDVNVLLSPYNEVFYPHGFHSTRREAHPEVMLTHETVTVHVTYGRSPTGEPCILSNPTLCSTCIGHRLQDSYSRY